jgi:hypothetical protein
MNSKLQSNLYTGMRLIEKRIFNTDTNIKPKLSVFKYGTTTVENYYKYDLNQKTIKEIKDYLLNCILNKYLKKSLNEDYENNSFLINNDKFIEYLNKLIKYSNKDLLNNSIEYLNIICIFMYKKNNINNTLFFLIILIYYLRKILENIDNNDDNKKINIYFINEIPDTILIETPINIDPQDSMHFNNKRKSNPEFHNLEEMIPNFDPLFYTNIYKYIYDNDIYSSNMIKLNNHMQEIIKIKGGANKYKKTENKITVIYKKKQYTRVIYICERKKYIKINKTFMLLSKLKKI